MAKKDEKLVYVRNLDRYAYKFKLADKTFVEISNFIQDSETGKIIQSGVISVTEATLAELKKNFLFAKKLENKKISISTEVPIESLSADERVKVKDAELQKVKAELKTKKADSEKAKTLAEENAKLKKQLEELTLENK